MLKFHPRALRPPRPPRVQRRRFFAERFTRQHRLETLEFRWVLDSTVVLNEMMYHPAHEGAPEWIELHNQMAVDMDVSSWSLAGGVSFEFPSETVIPGGGFLIVTDNPAAMQTVHGVAGALGPWSGRLANEGERIELRDNNWRLMNAIEYADGGQWPVAANGSGATLAKIDPMVGASHFATDWSASRRVGGSPARDNGEDLAGAGAPLVLNEVGASGNGFHIELASLADAPLPLAGVVIAIEGSTSARYQFPTQTLAAGAYLDLSSTTLGLVPTAGDRLFLYAADGQTVLDAVAVEPSSRGRSPDGSGPWRYTESDTWGAANRFDFEDAIVINEILYHHRPEPGRGATDPVIGSVELVGLGGSWRYNASGSSLPATWANDAHPVGGDWAQGQGLIGYDDARMPEPGIQTQLADPSRIPTVTYYFETEFVVTDQQATNGQLQLRHVIDDGAIIYLNGEEVARFNMGDGPVTAQTIAATSVNNAALSDVLALPTDALRAGTNRLSVEVHQGTPLSSDVMFGVELRVLSETQPAMPGSEYRENDEEWIELYNRGDSNVDLGGWRLTDAVDYEFPAGTTLAPGQYVVVAAHAQALRQRYPDLSNVIGDFSNRLGNGNERILLVDAAGNPADEVHYFDGGRWDERADGWGSSLELIDPRADNAQGGAWRASDEAAHSTWRTYSYRGIAQKSINTEPTLWKEFLLGFLDGAGEALVDDVSVLQDPGGAAVELIQNGSFDDGLAHWRAVGNHQQSRVADVDGNPVLHLVSDGATEYQGNQLETTFAGGAAIQDGTEYQISFRARWLSGSRQINSRLYFNRLPRTTILEVPATSGTPGRSNSQLMANAGPTFDQLRHAPAIPLPGEPVRVSVEAADPDGPVSLEVVYRVESGDWQREPMTADAGERWQGEIPGQEAGRVVQFYVEARDALGAVSAMPAKGTDSRALYIVEDGRTEDGQLHEFRVVMLDEDVDLLHRPTNSLSNGRLGATAIYEGVPFYDTGVRLKGSFVGRNAARVGFNIAFNPDQLFRGVHDKVSVDRSTHASLGVDEILIKHLANRAGGIPGMYDDLIHFVSPRRQHTGTASLRMAGFDEVYLDSQFENGSDGTVFENEVYRWATTTVDGDPESLKRAGGLDDPNGYVNIEFGDYGDSKETYRWNNLIVSNRTKDDYESIIELNRALTLSGDELDAATQQVLDVDQWMRTAAYQALVGPADAYYTGSNIHNFRLYVRPDGRVMYMPWDWDSAFQLGPRAALVGGGRLSRVVRLPANLRVYYGHMLDIIDSAFNRDYMQRWTEHYGELGGQSFAGRLSFIEDRAEFVVDRILTREAPPIEFAITTPGPLIVDDTAVTIEGKGWVNLRELRVSGSNTALSLNWSASEGRVADTWRATVPVSFGAQTLVLTAYDFRGNAIGSATIDVESTVERRPLEEFLRVSELHYHPAETDDAEFIELVNTSQGNAAVTLDLSGVMWTRGPSEPFRFPAGTVLPPGERLLVVGNRDAFVQRYPSVESSQLVGQFSGNLDNAGERITLESSTGTPIVDFTYGDSEPWPADPDGSGPSLELIDPADPASHQPTNPALWRASARAGGSPGEPAAGIDADFNADGRVDAADIEELYEALRSGGTDLRFDLTGDGRVDSLDRDELVHDTLATVYGDANLDGRFNSSDLVAVFQEGEYEDARLGNTSWQDGDWNGDGEFSSGDLVLAFQDGGYVAQAVAQSAAGSRDGARDARQPSSTASPQSADRAARRLAPPAPQPDAAGGNVHPANTHAAHDAVFATADLRLDDEAPGPF